MKTKFNEYLTKLRKSRVYTQAQMAEKLGISRSTYTNYENGNRTPDFEVLERISEVLACSLDELFGRKPTYVASCDVVKEDSSLYNVSRIQEEKPKLAIGVQDFRDLREKQAYYVDKTQFIEQFLESWYQITLITRPRRFGKTLNMSMLAEFLDCTKDSSDLFCGTKITKSVHYKELNRYPVVFLSFLNVKAGDAESLCYALKDTVRAEYERFYQMVNDGRLSEFQVKEFNMIYNSLCQESIGKEIENHVIRSIAVLCQALSTYYGEKVFLLLDEYDTPFMSANSEGYYDEVRAMLNRFLATSLKGNDYLQKAILTGIQRIAKENIFSGLNNLVVCTVQDEDYDDCFGFTEQEVKELLAYCKAEFSDELKTMYDGYHFGSTDVYNPWSISCYAARRRMDSYWVNTIENSILRNALEVQGRSFEKEYETLITEGEVEVTVDFSMAYYEKMDEANLWGLLVNAGIVTITKEIEEDYYRLRVPNLEVWKVFKELTACHLKIDERHMEKMLNALKRKDMERFAEEYQRVLLELPSYDDLKDENAYDPDGAKKILEEAGYKDVDGDGFVETPDGDPLVLDFVIYTSRAELGVYAQAAQASLKEIGINVNLNTVSYETLLDMRDSGQYDLLIWNVLVANTGDPENYLRENWYSSSANNTAGYNNPEVDKLLDELAQTFDEDKRKDLIIDIQQDIMDDAATVFFGYETTYLFSNKKVTGVKMYPMDYYWLTKDITLAE